MNITLKKAVTRLASERYIEHANQIDSMRDRILLNRRGNMRLTDIPQDPIRLQKRANRENTSDIKDAYERINGVANFQDVFILKKIRRMAEAVCRISIPSNLGSTSFGTGFLVAPNIIITNHHVFPSAHEAESGRVEFFYELDEHGVPHKSASFGLRPDLFFMTSDIVKNDEVSYSGLDFTLVAIDEVSKEGYNASQLSNIKLDENLGKILEGENCIVIQHPAGDYKKVVLKDIRMITFTEDYMVYESDTLPGSSGSMVIGLGTGEVVGLHHAAVPRKNANGEWLRKDGTVALDTDSDDMIDWIGNEGIRASRIVKAIKSIPLSAAMEQYREQILTSAVHNQENKTSSNMSVNSIPVVINEDVDKSADKRLQYFEVFISDKQFLQQDWKNKKNELVSGIKTTEQVFPFSTDNDLKRHYYISVESDTSEWELAAEIEKLPHIESCIPDMPVDTHTLPKTDRSSVYENAILKSETDENNWEDFNKKWKDAKWYKQAFEKDPNYVRQWNWEAVNAKESTIARLSDGLKKMKLVQLDTGYSDHTKTLGGYDFANDYDCIDNDHDAEGSYDRWRTPSLFPQIGHGTRTASLVIGEKLAYDPKNCDGNKGLLTGSSGPMIQLWPYRVAESVILLGRVKDMVEGARRAIDENADVMFMCMGIYPRPIINAVARYAYDNGVIWACAAGNYVKVVIAPALCPGTISVAAINPDNKPWDQSSYGDEVDIAAPGEDVYVPVVDKLGRESMRYGNGTSYATPHVAAAAMMWKAKHAKKLNKMYKEPWQIVEAFRWCLKRSANKNVPWIKNKTSKYYGAGLLDIDKLLKHELPNSDELQYAYKGISTQPRWDLGIIEAVTSIWKAIKRNISLREESMYTSQLTERGKRGMAVLTGLSQSGVLESSVSKVSEEEKEVILRTYFESFSK